MIIENQKIKCEHCDGKGFCQHGHVYIQPYIQGVHGGGRCVTNNCLECESKGFTHKYKLDDTFTIEDKRFKVILCEGNNVEVVEI